MGKDFLVEVDDGRTLACERFGAEGGVPMFFFHGYPGSRRDYRFADPEQIAAMSAGVDVVAISRPGYDLSDPVSNREIADWPADVATVADSLGWSKFAVMGYSGGGPYVLACARLIPERITSVVCVAPVGPPTTPGLAKSVGMLFAVVGEPARSGLIGVMSLLSKVTPDSLGLSLAKVVLPSTDRAFLANPVAAAGLMQTWRAAFTQGARGGVRDATLFSRPWGFRMEEIDLPVAVWHGTVDVNVRVSVGESLASSLPNGVLRTVEGEGHVSIFKSLPEMLTEVARP